MRTQVTLRFEVDGTENPPTSELIELGHAAGCDVVIVDEGPLDEDEPATDPRPDPRTHPEYWTE